METVRIFILGLVCLAAFFFVNNVHNQTQNRIAVLKQDLLSMLEHRDTTESELSTCHR